MELYCWLVQESSGVKMNSEMELIDLNEKEQF